MGKKQNNDGFSLLEVVLSMAILALLSIPLMSYFTQSMKYNAVILVVSLDKVFLVLSFIIQNIKILFLRLVSEKMVLMKILSMMKKKFMRRR